jgi:hypothetical protein
MLVQEEYKSVQEILPNGNIINYKIINGTAYYENTPDKVVNTLENARKYNERIRVFYGDRETGRDWKEEYDIIGYIGRSIGRIKIPLLIANSRSMGGGGILCDCIVKITIDKRIVYKHPDYYLGELTLTRDNLPEGYIEGVNIDGERHANFRKEGQTERWIEFMKGERNSK